MLCLLNGCHPPPPFFFGDSLDEEEAIGGGPADDDEAVALCFSTMGVSGVAEDASNSSV